MLGGLLAWRSESYAAQAAYCSSMSIAPTLAAIDVLEQGLQDALTLASYPSYLASSGRRPSRTATPRRRCGPCSAWPRFGHSYAALAACTGGLGDVKLAGALGPILGYRGISTAPGGRGARLVGRGTARGATP